MFNHILLPTDGSKLSMRAVHAGIGLAKALGARISALHTTSPFYPFQMLADEITDRQRKYEENAKDAPNASFTWSRRKHARRGSNTSCFSEPTTIRGRGS